MHRHCHCAFDRCGNRPSRRPWQAARHFQLHRLYPTRLLFGLFFQKKAGVKRPLFLLEILIGLTLMSILISVLFTSMARSAEFETKIDKAKAELLEREHLQARL